jgi:hypothetical protein
MPPGANFNLIAFVKLWPHVVPLRRHFSQQLGVPPETKDSVFYEQYDTEPIINIKDPAVVEPLKARMQAALAKP